MPLWKLVAAADGLAQPPDRELLAAVRDAVADPDAPEVDLAASAALTDMVRGTPLDESGAVCSVDLMIAADSATAWERGRYEVVLGDVHDTCLLTDWALQFHPEAARIRTARDAAMAGAFGRRPAVNILAGRQTGIPRSNCPALSSNSAASPTGATPGPPSCATWSYGATGTPRGCGAPRSAER